MEGLRSLVSTALPLPVGKVYRRMGHMESRRHPGQFYLYSTRPGVSHWIFSECASSPHEVSLLKHDEEIGSLRCFSVAQVVLYIYIVYMYIRICIYTIHNMRYLDIEPAILELTGSNVGAKKFKLCLRAAATTKLH